MILPLVRIESGSVNQILKKMKVNVAKERKNPNLVVKERKKSNR